MNPTVRSTALAALSLAAQIWIAAGPILAAEKIGTVRNFELTYTTTVAKIPEGAKRFDLWLPYPVGDPHQEIDVTIDSPVPFQIEKEATSGNSMVHISLLDAAGQSLQIGMKVAVSRTEYSRRDLERAKPRLKKVTPDLSPWLKADELVPLSDRIRKIAFAVTKGKKTDADRARAIYDYVVDTMSYDKTGTGWGQGDINWACDAKRGNCTDFHALFIGLARSVGIPAKFEIGFPIPAGRGQGEIGGYHCWSEFYLDGYGWVPVDASEARKHPERRDYFFGGHDENRVQFTTGRDLNLAPPQKGKPLNYFIYPYAEVDGKAFTEGMSKAFAYRDLAVGAPRDHS